MGGVRRETFVTSPVLTLDMHQIKFDFCAIYQIALYLHIDLVLGYSILVEWKRFARIQREKKVFREFF